MANDTTAPMQGEMQGEMQIEGALIESNDAGAVICALNASEINQQIATAKRWPRSITRFRQEAMALACLDEETAQTMFYSLPRSGKKLEGPSVRLAEIVGSSWGNLRYGSRIVSTDDTFTTAQGACFDLEKNVAISYEVKRRITNRDGKRFNDDMIQTTQNAACSIALRQAIFKVIPFALVKPIYQRAREVAIGDASSLVERRAKAIEWFCKAGATEAQVLQSIDRKGLEDVTLEDLLTLTGLRTAIKDGESTIEEALGAAPENKAKVRKSELNDTVGHHSADSGKKVNKPADAAGWATGTTPEKTESKPAPADAGRDPGDDDDPLGPFLDDLRAATSATSVSAVSVDWLPRYADRPELKARAEVAIATRRGEIGEAKAKK